jgi:hypothetical protein
VRAVEATGGVQRYLALIQALGVVVEDHLVLDDRGALVERCAPPPAGGVETSLAAPWHEALGALLPLEATPSSPGDRARMAGVHARVGVGARRPRRCPDHDPPLSSRLADVYRAAWTGTPAMGRRAIAQQLVREVLGLVAPAARDAAARWLAALPPARQESELTAAARRDRVTLAKAALLPLGRLLDAVETGAMLPA